MSWMDSLIPNDQQWKEFRGSLMTIKNVLSDKIEIGLYIIYYFCNLHI